MSNWLNNISFSFILISLVLLNSCGGCSQSGIKNRQKVRDDSADQQRSVGRSDDNVRVPIQKNSNSILSDNTLLPLNELYDKYKSSVFLVYTSDGLDGYQGTGFFISENGIAISNYHVFKGTSKGLEVIETYNGQKLKIDKVLSKSDEHDYIIFKVGLSGYTINNPIPITFEEPHIGEDVFAIGNPRGLESTLSKGIVSGFRENKKLIQTTTEITHGSSGGPLLSMKGEVVGITSAGLGEANLNFAINIKHLPLSEYDLNN